MTDKTPTDAQQYLNVASQCAATATSELAKNVLVDDGSGTLRELLNDAADAIRAGWGQQAPAPAASVQEDAARYRFLRDGEWRDTDLEPFIRLQLNTLWDAKIDAARAAQEGGK